MFCLKKKRNNESQKQIKHINEFYKSEYIHTYDPCITDSTAEYYEFENGEPTSYIRYVIDGNTLIISDIVGKGKDTDYHHGTELMIALLNYLKQPFDMIRGKLSWVDAEKERGWKVSIPFYQDLPYYIDKKTGLKYKFYLFDDDNYTNDVTKILTPKETREEAVSHYIKSHLYDELRNTKNRSGSFCYLLSQQG